MVRKRWKERCYGGDCLPSHLTGSLQGHNATALSLGTLTKSTYAPFHLMMICSGHCRPVKPMPRKCRVAFRRGEVHCHVVRLQRWVGWDDSNGLLWSTVGEIERQIPQIHFRKTRSRVLGHRDPMLFKHSLVLEQLFDSTNCFLEGLHPRPHSPRCRRPQGNVLTGREISSIVEIFP